MEVDSSSRQSKSRPLITMVSTARSGDALNDGDVRGLGVLGFRDFGEIEQREKKAS
jgi:hypothetical protein